MRSAQQVVPPSSEDALDRKAELYDALHVMLEEAGSRGTPRDAMCVITGILESLAQDYDEIRPLVIPWKSLMEAEFSRHQSLLTDDDSAGSVASSSVRYLVVEPQKKQEG